MENRETFLDHTNKRPRRTRPKSFHGMDTSFYQRDLGTNRKWKLCLCEEICGKHGVHDVSDTGPYLVVLRRIPAAVRDHTRRRIPSGLAKLGYVGSRTEKPHHHRRFDGRNGPKGGFTVYEKESPQKHQRDVHRTKLIPQRKNITEP